jgi:predicted metal-dependent peptidase
MHETNANQEREQQRIADKLAAARTKLILDHPFLGALALRLPLQAVEDQAWCKTTGTDAKHLFYNPGYIDSLSPQQTQFMVAHEALHCGLSHFARRNHRNKVRWDLACDLAINPLLKEEGLQPPPGYLIIDDYQGLTAEEIYPLLDENPESEQPDEHLYDKSESEGGSGGSGGGEQGERRQGKGGGSRDRQERQQGRESEDQGQPPPLTPDERETLNVQWQQRMAGAAQQAMQMGRLGGSLARMIDHLLQPQLPWRMVLARYLSNTARDDYTYMRPSRREGEFILPSLRSQEIDLVVALDTSASIREQEFAEFIAEINAIKGQLRARIHLVACDSELSVDGPWVFEPWEDFQLPQQFTGGGGTWFKPVFDWVERKDVKPQALIYFTDAEGDFPPAPPDYPVLWLIKGKLPVPWGERIQLN